MGKKWALKPFIVLGMYLYVLFQAVMFMTLFPEVQEKCRKEINEEIGIKPPTIDDVQKLPYVMATLMEIQRMAIVAPGSLPHILMKDIKINNYQFKKGTIFTANLSKFQMDSEVFSNPNLFNPDRFRDENGKVRKIEQLVPFGIGKRICMGKTLAKNQMFIFFVRMLQRITFEETSNKPNIHNVIYGVTWIPKPFEVKILMK